MKDKDKRFTPIMLYTSTTLSLLGALGGWYFFFIPSGYKYSTDVAGLTITIINLIRVIGFTILCLCFIKISENKLSRNFWFLLMMLHFLHAASKHSPIVRLSIMTLEFMLFSSYLYIYKQDDINLFGKFDVIRKKKHNASAQLPH